MTVTDDQTPSADPLDQFSNDELLAHIGKDTMGQSNYLGGIAVERILPYFQLRLLKVIADDLDTIAEELVNKR